MVNNDRTSRPLLLISDRISDLFPVLQHASTYQVIILPSCWSYVFILWKARLGRTAACFPNFY